MNGSERLRRLREAEVPCFRICCHLLQSEELAHEAAKEALLRLYASDAYFDADGPAQAALLREAAAAACFRLHAARRKAVGA